MAAQRQDEEANPNAVAPPSARSAAATPRAPVRDPYAMGPTNYESFSRQYDSNAATAQRGAQHLAQKVSGEAQAAGDALQRSYGGFSDQVGSAQRGAVRGETAYGGPQGWTADDALRQQYSTASADAHALGGSTGSVQALMGPHASSFGAGLVRHAGGRNFQSEAQHYAGLRGQIGQFEGASQTAAQNAAGSAADSLKAQHDAAREEIKAERMANYGGGDSSSAGASPRWDAPIDDASVRAHEIGAPDAGFNGDDRAGVHGHYDSLTGAWVEE